MLRHSEGREVIVVGLNHTAGGSAALRWALDEGVRSNTRVLAVNVYDRSRADLVNERDHEGAKSLERMEAHRQLIDILGSQAPRVSLAISQVDGAIAQRLTAAAEGASLLVIGEPCDPAQADLAGQLAHEATCPVVVVRSDGTAAVVEPVGD